MIRTLLFDSGTPWCEFVMCKTPRYVIPNSPSVVLISVSIGNTVQSRQTLFVWYCLYCIIAYVYGNCVKILREAAKSCVEETSAFQMATEKRPTESAGRFPEK